jgi:alanine racemase
VSSLEMLNFIVDFKKADSKHKSRNETEKASGTLIPKIHIEVDSGISRSGFTFKKLKEALPRIKRLNDKKKIDVVGLWTHFSSADEIDSKTTREELLLYGKAKKLCASFGILPDFCHVSNSAHLLRDDTSNEAKKLFNHIRPGITIYGLSPNENFSCMFKKLGVKPAMKLTAKIAHVAEAEKGTKISYNGIYEVNEKTKIANVPIGYSDGISSGLSADNERIKQGKGFKVLIEKKDGTKEFAPIVGKVCMDQFVIDLGKNSTVKLGDKVTIFDGDKNPFPNIDDFAKKAGLSNYEIITKMGSDRIKRVYETT